MARVVGMLLVLTLGCLAASCNPVARQAEHKTPTTPGTAERPAAETGRDSGFFDPSQVRYHRDPATGVCFALHPQWGMATVSCDRVKGRLAGKPAVSGVVKY